jgi:hypothetical protein
VRLAGAPVADDRGALRGEVLRLVGLVLLVDAVFIAGYFIAGLAAASANLTSGYMIAWTVVTLAVVLRGLGRVRAARLRARRER